MSSSRDSQRKTGALALSSVQSWKWPDHSIDSPDTIQTLEVSTVWESLAPCCSSHAYALDKKPPCKLDDGY